MIPTIPDELLRVTCVIDPDAPEDHHPVFVFSGITGRVAKQIMGALRKFDAKAGGDEVIDALYDTLRINLVDWENVATESPRLKALFGVEGESVAKLPYRPELLEDLLPVSVIAGVLKGLIDTIDLGSGDRKNSASPASSRQA